MELNIAYTIDVQGNGAFQFIDQLLCSIYSIKSTKRSEDNIKLYIVYGNIPSDLIIKLNKLSSDDFKINYTKLQSQELARLQQFTRQSPSGNVRAWCGIVYARIFLAQYLPQLDKVLYLDSDTMIKSSLHELYDTDLEGKWLGMVMGCVPEYGFNSGVMIFDLSKFREDPDLWKNLDEHMRRYARSYFCPDQTVINRFFGDKIKPLDFKYNYPPAPGYMGHDPMIDSAVIWHFYNQTVKPIRFDDQGIALVNWYKNLIDCEKIINKEI